jgi:hypothetical protein
VMFESKLWHGVKLWVIFIFTADTTCFCFPSPRSSDCTIFEIAKNKPQSTKDKKWLPVFQFHRSTSVPSQEKS